MLELAARSIGGLCSRALRFPGGSTLEELVLASALGQRAPAISGHPARPAGIYMLPVPRPGVLRAVDGRDSAAAIPGITGLTITIPAGQHVDPLPDGDRYLGFIFAEGATRDQVEQALTTARDQLRVIIDLPLATRCPANGRLSRERRKRPVPHEEEPAHQPDRSS
jgi:hypothetical protein